MQPYRKNQTNKTLENKGVNKLLLSLPISDLPSTPASTNGESVGDSGGSGDCGRRLKSSSGFVRVLLLIVNLKVFSTIIVQLYCISVIIKVQRSFSKYMTKYK